MPDLSQYEIKQFRWFQCYSNAVEEFPPNTPVPKGEPVVVNGYFDASHTSYLVARRLITGILVFMNNTSIEWYLNHQGTVK